MNEKPNNVISFEKKGLEMKREKSWKKFQEMLVESLSDKRLLFFKNRIFAKEFSYETDISKNEAGQFMSTPRKIPRRFNQGVYTGRRDEDYVFWGDPIQKMSTEETSCYFWISEKELRKKIFDEKGNLTVKFE